MNKKEFTKYLEGKNLTAKTITTNIKHVEKFFAKIRKEDVQITKPDILDFLEYLKNRKHLQNSSRRLYLTDLHRYFSFLQSNEQTSKNPCSLLKIRGQKHKTLYKIYTPEELDLLNDNYYHLFVRNYDYSSYRHKQQQELSAISRERNAVILSVLTNQGITTGEIEKLETGDLDLIKATIKIRGGKRSNERVLPLKATQIGLFINYLKNIRPQILEYQTTETEKLFLLLPQGSKKQIDNSDLSNLFLLLKAQIQTIDKQFINFTKIRASVITLWLKTYNLRKTQYLAGHRYVSSTERYQSNDLDSLINDINKMHPFL